VYNFALPQHYWPVTVSRTLSKLVELYILDLSGYHRINYLKVVFVAGRGTNMATSLACDVIIYCIKRGSPVYSCSSDAVAHAILVNSTMNVISDQIWVIMVKWSMSVQVKWGSILRESIKVCKFKT